MISHSMPAAVFQMKMSGGELAFVNVQDDDDDDALTTEEELCLRQDTMREFFLQQLKILRESVVSSQTKMQEHLKASREATDTNLKDELNHYTERLQAQIKTDLQMLEEHFKTAGHRVEEMVKAMGESVTKRMNDMDKELKELTSRITAVEVEVCSVLASGPLSSTQVPDDGGVTEISVDIQSLLLLSLTGPSQDAVLTTTRDVESITDQPSEEAGPLSSTRVPDEGGVTEISLDIESLPPLSPTGPSQDAVLTTTSDVESITDQPSEEAGPLSSTRVPDEGSVTEISLDIESLPGSSGVHKWPISCKRKVAQSLEDLVPELATKLRPYTKSRVTKQEKITGLQSAYFNFQMDRLKITVTFGAYKAHD